MARWFQPLRSAAAHLMGWVRNTPHISAACTLITVVVVMLFQTRDYHEGFRQLGQDALWMIERQGDAAPQLRMKVLAFSYYVLPYMGLCMLAGGLVLHVAILRAIPDVKRALRPTWVACIFLTVYCVLSDLSQHLEYLEISITGEPVSLTTYVMKLIMIVIPCMTPALALTYYHRTMLLDRYTLRTFLQPLLFCFIAFCSLWILMDLLDSLKDFQDAKTSLGEMALFYINLVPYIFVSIAPAAILLSVLYTLTKMSRSNEIVSMLTAGRSVSQILRPIFVCAGFSSALAFAANYYWAPRAEGNRQAVMRAITEGEEGTVLAEKLMFRNEETRRTWFAGAFPFDLRSEKLRNVEVRQENEKGELQTAWIARSAMWWPGENKWRFYYGVEVRYVDGKKDSQIDFTGRDGAPFRNDIIGMEETPWSIVSSALMPDFMGVPDLVSYLTAHEARGEEKLAPFRTHLHHRFAFPWQSLTLALVAAPLGLSFSRRGVLGGVAGSIFIFFGMMFVNDLFLNLGKGGHLPAYITVWIPVLGFGLLGGVLLWFRSQNKELPNLSPMAWFRKPAVVKRPQNRPIDQAT